MKNDKKRFKKISCFSCLFILAGLWLSHVHAQSGRGKGQLPGIVINEAGEPVANASVQLIWQEELAVSRETNTNTRGKFRFIDLASGKWELWVKAKGYVSTYMPLEIRQLAKIGEIKIILKRPTKALLMELLKDSGRLLEQGHQLYDAGRYDEARAFYSEFLKQHPEFYQVHLFMGDCYKALGANELAMAEYQKMSESIARMTPAEKAMLYAAVGDFYLRREDPASAVKYFDQSLEWNPDPQLCFHLGQDFLSMNRKEESIRYFNRAAALKTGWGDPYLQLGYIYLNSGEPDNAAVNFKKFLELSPDADESAAIKVLLKKLLKTLD